MKKAFPLSAGVIAASAALAAAVRPKRAEPPPTAAVGNDRQSVLVVFDRPVDHISMTPEATLEMAQAMVGHAIALNPALGNRVFMPLEAELAPLSEDDAQAAPTEATPSYPEGFDMTTIGQQPDEKWATEVCRMGSGAEHTCAFLGRGPAGFLCAKSDPAILELILERRAMGTLKAQANNCPGRGSPPVVGGPAGTVH